ncbi:hypothetical protein M885DRAFT_523878 [Pelagophyceae sp. CCMP2097]|nr:hypothetical protein M885DRAFT_523878 [Pelagophyceae sp. CCMP2097]
MGRATPAARPALAVEIFGPDGAAARLPARRGGRDADGDAGADARRAADLERAVRRLRREGRALDAQTAAHLAAHDETRTQTRALSLHVRAELEATSRKPMARRVDVDGFESSDACVLRSQVAVLRKALPLLEAACAAGDTRVATTRDRLARARAKLAAVPALFSRGPADVAALRRAADAARTQIERTHVERSARVTRYVADVEHDVRRRKAAVAEHAVERAAADAEARRWRSQLLASRARLEPLRRRCAVLREELLDFIEASDGGASAVAGALFLHPRMARATAAAAVRVAFGPDEALPPLPAWSRGRRESDASDSSGDESVAASDDDVTPRPAAPAPADEANDVIDIAQFTRMVEDAAQRGGRVAEDAAPSPRSGWDAR